MKKMTRHMTMGLAATRELIMHMKKGLLYAAALMCVSQALVGCGTEPGIEAQPATASEVQQPQPEELGQQESGLAVSVGGCAGNLKSIYRFYSSRLNKHNHPTTALQDPFYWAYEFVMGALFDANFAPCGAVPLYSSYAYSRTDQLLTTNSSEGGSFYSTPTVAGYCFPFQAPGTIPLYRYFSPQAAEHLYTMNFNELGYGNGYYNYEGVTCYIYPRYQCPTTADIWRGAGPQACACSPSQVAAHTIWGTNTYLDYSNPCQAAVHAGQLSSTYRQGTIRVTPTPAQSSYQSSTQNGITSNGHGWYYGSFTVAAEQ
ncbi:MAG TPA: LCCL domain-containing protein [Archangium sp.]|uniref:LCCL domain-containing protein n=1 Tax=Archangium sp. TaxID=1872627 RepID=UPI002E313FCC|nr:LCCL domain-containing protein [Archangium sp.]HEX5746976.1 LCCL domain-containing protein [Archangium sp.]